MASVNPMGLYADVTVIGDEVIIVLPIKYVGPGLIGAPGTEERFNKAIEDMWSRAYINLKVRVSVVTPAPFTSPDKMNYIYVPAGDERAFCSVDGYPRGTGIFREETWPAGSDPWVAAHEAGHLMGLIDRYFADFTPHPGYEGNIMGERNGIPRYSDIIEIIQKNKVGR